MNFFVEVLLAAGGRFLRALGRSLPASLGAEGREAVGKRGRDAEKLFDRALDRVADRAHGLVDRDDRVDGTVGRGVDLVELVVHPVDRPADLVDHRHHLSLGSADERRHAAEDSGQLHEDEREDRAHGNQEDRQRVVDDVARGGRQHSAILLSRDLDE